VFIGSSTRKEGQKIMQAVILAGGLATRLGDLTRYRPKSMVPVAGKPFLEYQLEFLRKGGIRDVVLCVGHLANQIEAYFSSGRSLGVSIRYSYEAEPLGTAGTIKNAEALLDEIFFVIYGDSYIFLDFRQAVAVFEDKNKQVLMTVYKNNDRYDRSNTAVNNGLVTAYSKTVKSEDMVYIDYGATIFRNSVLEMIPPNMFYSLEALIPGLVEKGEVIAFEAKHRFYEIGSLQGLQEFEKYCCRGSK
jgi:NDP-sugar pyrophosphorylase family protein